MSELNDYLEGKITFEEFEKRREERKAKDKVTCSHILYSPNVIAQIRSGFKRSNAPQ